MAVLYIAFVQSHKSTHILRACYGSVDHMAVGDGSLIVTAKGTDFIMGCVGHVGILNGKVINNALVHTEETTAIGSSGW